MRWAPDQVRGYTFKISPVLREGIKHRFGVDKEVINPEIRFRLI